MKKLLLLTLLIAYWILLALSLFTSYDALTAGLTKATLLLLAITSSILFIVHLAHAVSKSNEARKYIKVPEYRLDKVKFYELSMLLDGHMDMKDVLAILVHYALFTPEKPDATEEIILKSTSSHTISTLYRMYYLEMQTEEEMEANILKELLKEIKGPAVTTLRSQNYFKYNPTTIKYLALVFIVLSAFPALAAAAMLGLLSTLALVIALVTSFIGIHLFLYASQFYENYQNVLPVQAKALGYEMYLKTVEWHTVERDQEKFRQFIPYFLLYGLKKDRFEDMINYTLEFMQKNSKLTATA